MASIELSLSNFSQLARVYLVETTESLSRNSWLLMGPLDSLDLRGICTFDPPVGQCSHSWFPQLSSTKADRALGKLLGRRGDPLCPIGAVAASRKLKARSQSDQGPHSRHSQENHSTTVQQCNDNDASLHLAQRSRINHERIAATPWR